MITGINLSLYICNCLCILICTFLVFFFLNLNLILLILHLFVWSDFAILNFSSLLCEHLLSAFVDMTILANEATAPFNLEFHIFLLSENRFTWPSTVLIHYIQLAITRSIFFLSWNIFLRPKKKWFSNFHLLKQCLAEISFAKYERFVLLSFIWKS